MESSDVNETTVEPRRKQRREAATNSDTKRRRQPPYNVILWDDDDHSYDFVIRMMRDLFGYPKERANKIAEQVDKQGRAICLTTTREHAELKRDQIHAFGRDEAIERCRGSMRASIEPVED